MIDYQGQAIDLFSPWPTRPMTDVVSEDLGRTITIDTPDEELRAACDEHDIEYTPEWTAGKLIAELFDELGEAILINPTFVVDYPVEVSPLAKRHEDDPRLTHRFELFIAAHEYANAFSDEVLGRTITIDTPVEELRAACDEHDIEYKPEWTAGKLIAELFDELGEAILINPTFVVDYPVEVSPLAKRHEDDPRLTHRFELFIAAHEYANAFSELNDPVDQDERFAAQMEEKAGGDASSSPSCSTSLARLSSSTRPSSWTTPSRFPRWPSAMRTTRASLTASSSSSPRTSTPTRSPSSMTRSIRTSASPRRWRRRQAATTRPWSTTRTTCARSSTACLPRAASDYVRALEYGMPPAGGIGIGIDRVVMLLTNSTSIRDVLLFPHMKPEKGSKSGAAAAKAAQMAEAAGAASPFLTSMKPTNDYSKVVVEPLFEDFVESPRTTTPRWSSSRCSRISSTSTPLPRATSAP